MADQTAAVLAVPDQTEPASPAEQTGPGAVDDAYWVAAVRAAYPKWQTDTPTVDEVQSVVGGGRSRAVRLRRVACELPDSPAEKPAARRPRPDRTMPARTEVQVSALRPESGPQRSGELEAQTADQTESDPLTPAEVDRILAEFLGVEQTAPDRTEDGADFLSFSHDLPEGGAGQTPPAPARRPVRRRGQSGRVVAYVGAGLGGLGSVAANVLHSFVQPRPAGAPQTWVPDPEWMPEPGAVVGAMFWPVAVLVAVEIFSRVDWPAGRRWVALRFGGLLPVALVAAFVSYRHLSALLAHWGDDPLTVAAGPLAVDGLMVMATGALIALGRARNTDQANA
jgi:hypothetical protein